MITAALKRKHIKRSAHRRGIECTLTLEDVRWLMSATVCPLCEKPFDENDPERKFTIERTNPNAGYTRKNTIPCCYACNSEKNHKSDCKIVDHAARRLRKAQFAAQELHIETNKRLRLERIAAQALSRDHAQEDAP